MIGIDARCPRCRTDASRQIVDMGHERPICSRDAMSAPPPIATGLPYYGGRRQGLTRRLVREREQAPPLSVLQIFRSVVDDPVARAAPAPADIIIDRPSSIVAPNRNLRTTIR